MKRALVLEGGGAKGSYELGAILALKDIQIDCVVGTSIGAINGAFFVSNQLDELYEIWNNIDCKKILGTDSNSKLYNYLYLLNNKIDINEIKRILEAESVDCGYLDINSPGTEAPDNVEGVEVTMSGDKVSDRIAKIKKSGRGFPFGAHYSRLAEDIETQKYITNDQQKKASANTGTKMGLNIAASKENSNGTMRKRKHDIEKHKRELPKNVFDKTYSRIEKIVKAQQESGEKAAKAE